MISLAGESSAHRRPRPSTRDDLEEPEPTTADAVLMVDAARGHTLGAWPLSTGRLEELTRDDAGSALYAVDALALRYRRAMMPPPPLLSYEREHADSE